MEYPTSTPPPTSQSGVPTLHHLSSSQSLRILWALEELTESNPSFTYKLQLHTRIKARAPKELQSIHPLGLSPILVIEPKPSEPGSQTQENGAITVTESRLILQYLADHYSNGVWDSQTPQDRVRNNYFQEFSQATLGPKAVSILLFDFIPGHVPFLFRPLASLVFNGLAGIVKKDLVRMFQLMEDALADADGEGKHWFSGEKIGLADFCLSWPMDLCEQRGYFDAAMYPRIGGWLSKVHERDAYVEAKKKGGSYDLVNFDWK
ncbi:unnamed protein product [Calypogeia fissa]